MESVSLKHENISVLIDEEIELLEYVTAILGNKYRIVLISMSFAAMTFGVTFFIPERFESVVNIALVKLDSLGGIVPDNRRASEVISLLEHDFLSQSVHDNYQDRIMAKMRSQVFTEYFIGRNNLLPVIFHKHWDKQQKLWIDSFKPNITLASRIFRKNICGIEHIKENNLMRVRIRLGDANLAAQLANKFVTDFNNFMREKALGDADNKLGFLRNELEQTDIVEMRKSVYRLMEAQLVSKMLASNKRDYTLEVLDPAIPAIEKASPAKKRLTVFAFIASVMLCFIFIIGRIVFKKIHRSIKRYELDFKKRQKGGGHD